MFGEPYFLLFPRARIILMVPIFFLPFFFELPAVTYLGLWFVIQLVSGTAALVGPGQVGGIAFWAHVGGFAAGMSWLPLFLAVAPSYRPPARDEYGPQTGWSAHVRPRNRPSMREPSP